MVLGSAATRCGSYSTISELMVWFNGVGLFVEPVALQRRKSSLQYSYQASWATYSIFNFMEAFAPQASSNARIKDASSPSSFNRCVIMDVVVYIVVHILWCLIVGTE